MKDYPYFDLHVRDGSGIAFEHWTDSRSVALHMHDYFELFLIERGPCRHMFDETETLLIPGDAVIVPPHNPHGFSLSGESSIYNCQFLKDAIDASVMQLLQEHGGSNADGGDPNRNLSRSNADPAEQSLKDDRARWSHLLADRENYYGLEDAGQDTYRANPGRRGVIHLNPREFTFIESLFADLPEGNEEKGSFYALKKQKFTEVILLELHQALNRQNQIYKVYAGEKGAAVAEAILYIGEHLTEPLDFAKLADTYGFSPNHFRKLFRESTGLSPVKYLNRQRITRACEYMQQEHVSAHEAAERVGFVDMNYFSRVFKQVMGCPPGKL